MDNYNEHKFANKKLKLTCNNYNLLIRHPRILTGSGGSESIILIGNINGVNVAIKCVPLRKKTSIYERNTKL